ncbi:hypothetical protein [Acidocella sp.]|uniref:hypothetical protein n=1 Tax=Acidocella sp. TaxID=50710 RepID=UPI00261939C3|nr:hypothetical protein [Acidocella sp.]
MPDHAGGAARRAEAVLLCHLENSTASFDGVAAFDILWRTSSLISKLAAGLPEAATPPAVAPGQEEAQRLSQMTQLEALRHDVDQICMLHAQRHDYFLQIKSGLEKMLRLLIMADGDDAASMTVDDLLGLYVSEDQRQAHARALDRPSLSSPWPGGQGEAGAGSALR